MTLIRESAELNRRERDKIEYLTPGSPISYTLPSVGMISGDTIRIINNGTATITVLASNTNTVTTINPKADFLFTALIASPIAPANFAKSMLNPGDVIKVVPVGFTQGSPTASYIYDDATILTLGAGKWEIHATINQYNVTGSVPAVAQVALYIAGIRDSSAIDTTQMWVRTGNVASGYEVISTHMAIPVSIDSGTRDYNLIILWEPNSGSPTVSSLGLCGSSFSPARTSQLYAVRIG